jgi:hypothetical protein
VTAEDSAYSGQAGRVGRVFWREGAPWLLVRSRSGAVFALPWAATDLPTIAPAPADAPGDADAPLLSAVAVQTLARFCCQHRAGGKGKG